MVLLSREKALERISFRLTQELKEKIEIRAEEEGRTLSNLIVNVLSDYIKKVEEAKKLLQK